MTDTSTALRRRTSTASPYIYTPLHKDVPSIRLLRLLASSQPEQIACELTLSYVGGDNPYEAVSYYWGDLASTQRMRSVAILLDKKQFLVTPIVHDILRRLHDPARDRLLWIDLICIDQENVIERNIQVSRMNAIFSHAKQVIASLGPHFPVPGFPNSLNMSTVAKFLKSTESSSSLVRLRHLTRKAWRREHSYEKVTKVVMKILQHPWFRRIWIVQEVLVAQKLVLMSQRAEVAGHDFARLLDLLEQRAEENFRQEMCRAQLLFQATRSVSSTYEKARLIELLHRYRSWDATDPRDKVYALYGLCIDDFEATEIEVNYSISAQELYQRVVLYFIRTARNLEILTYCIPQRHEQTVVTASWVPNWAEKKKQPDEAVASLTIDARTWSGDLSQSVQCTSSGALKVCGIEVASVTSLFLDGTIEVVPTGWSAFVEVEARDSWDYSKASRHFERLHASLVHLYGAGLQVQDIICALWSCSGLAVLRAMKSGYALVVLERAQYPPLWFDESERLGSWRTSENTEVPELDWISNFAPMFQFLEWRTFELVQTSAFSLADKEDNAELGLITKDMPVEAIATLLH